MDGYQIVSFKATEELTAIITAVLMNEGFEAVEEKEEETIASIPLALFNEQAVKVIFNNYSTLYTVKKVAQQNWNAQWESSFEPVIIEKFVTVRASFHQKNTTVLHDIIITPKMSFGTGHHATTYLMIQEMESINFKNKSVIDFGTGTGVLAILAEKLGAASVLAIDNDEWSINNANENIKANDCSLINLQLSCKMLDHQTADVLLANINLNVIIENMCHIKKVCTRETTVLLSGMLLCDVDAISGKISQEGFYIDKITDKEGWVVLSVKLLKAYAQ